jgi:hypothetical protein
MARTTPRPVGAQLLVMIMMTCGPTQKVWVQDVSSIVVSAIVPVRPHFIKAMVLFMLFYVLFITILCINIITLNTKINKKLRKTIYCSLANIITILLFPIAAMCRSTWREETKIYVLHSFKSYNNHFQYFIYKKNYLTNIIIVLLFPIAAIYRSTRRKEVII